MSISAPEMDAQREPETSRPRSVLEAVCSIQPYHVLLLGLLPGFSLLFGSLVLGIATWKAKSPEFAGIEREVGYWPALNWSITYAILFPLVLYLMTNAICGLANALDRLHARGMVRTKNMERVSDPLLTSAWLVGSRTRSRLLLIFAVLIPAAFGLIEWFLNNFLRLVHLAAVPAHSDYDWGLAGLMADWSLPHRLTNAFFDLLAFTTEILLISSLMAFFIVILDLGRIMPTGRRGETLLLVPDLDADDKRLGFEEFASPLEQLLGVALIAYLICYLVRLEGAYMASSDSSSLAAFVNGDIFRGIKQAASSPKPAGLADVFIGLFNLGEQQIRGTLDWLMAVLVAVFSLVTVVITVRGAAISAKLNAVQSWRDSSVTLGTRDPASASAALESMVIWPLGYLTLNALLFWIVVAVITLALYRVGLFIAGVVSFSLFLRLTTRLLRPGKTAGPVAKNQEDGSQSGARSSSET